MHFLTDVWIQSRRPRNQFSYEVLGVPAVTPIAVQPTPSYLWPLEWPLGSRESIVIDSINRSDISDGSGSVLIYPWIGATGLKPTCTAGAVGELRVTTGTAGGEYGVLEVGDIVEFRGFDAGAPDLTANNRVYRVADKLTANTIELDPVEAGTTTTAGTAAANSVAFNGAPFQFDVILTTGGVGDAIRYVCPAGERPGALAITTAADLAILAHIEDNAPPRHRVV